MFYHQNGASLVNTGMASCCGEFCRKPGRESMLYKRTGTGAGNNNESNAIENLDYTFWYYSLKCQQ